MAAILSHSVRRYLATTAAKNAVRVEGPSAVSGGHEGGFKMWRSLSFFVAFPAIALCGVNCYITHEHLDAPEFVKYDHLRLRSKRFPWGDGQKSLFHNPHTNALPDGYEH
nr:cytochrome c oxidase subunit 6A2, mitochondrial-like [Onthophagus taurus]